jgi:hypothetical protein
MKEKSRLLAYKTNREENRPYKGRWLENGIGDKVQKIFLEAFEEEGN